MSEKTKDLEDKNECSETKDIEPEHSSENKKVTTTKKESSFLTSTVTKKDEDEKCFASEDLELKRIQEELIAASIKDEVLFKSRCKLLFLNKEKKKFEERGVGDIMINKEKEGQMVKIVMIRERIMKFGCNHYINPRYKLEPHTSLSNAWFWGTAEDTLEDNEKGEQQIYLVKFENDEDSNAFKKGYEEGLLNNKKLIEERKK